MSEWLVLPWRTKLSGLSPTVDACVISADELMKLAVVSWEISYKSSRLGTESMCKMEDFLESSIYDLISNCWKATQFIEQQSLELGVAKNIVASSLIYDVYRRVNKLRSILSPTLCNAFGDMLISRNLSIEQIKPFRLGLLLQLVEYPCRY